MGTDLNEFGHGHSNPEFCSDGYTKIYFSVQMCEAKFLSKPGFQLEDSTRSDS